jgi:hypothetical protein
MLKSGMQRTGTSAFRVLQESNVKNPYQPPELDAVTTASSYFVVGKIRKDGYLQVAAIQSLEKSASFISAW